MGAFGFDFAAYADWSLKKKMVSPQNCPCDVSKTKYIAGGFYRDDLSTGLGVAMPARNFSAGRINGGGGTEPMWRNHSFHMSGRDTLDGIASKAFVWFVRVGPRHNAETFAKGIQ